MRACIRPRPTSTAKLVNLDRSLSFSPISSTQMPGHSRRPMHTLPSDGKASHRISGSSRSSCNSRRPSLVSSNLVVCMVRRRRTTASTLRRRKRQRQTLDISGKAYRQHGRVVVSIRDHRRCPHLVTTGQKSMSGMIKGGVRWETNERSGRMATTSITDGEYPFSGTC